ncbi:MAG: serine--tRNA ligase [bacterium]
MIDIKIARNNPETIVNALKRRRMPATVVEQLAALDIERRKLIVQSDELKQLKNTVSREIGHLKAKGEAAEEQSLRMRGVGEEIKTLEEGLFLIEKKINELLMSLPNILQDNVPDGESEKDNVEIRRVGDFPKADFTPLPHWELAERLGIIDFERGVKLSGTRFYVLKGAGARLQRALIAWMLDLHISRHGYTEVYLPFMVKEECMYAAGQLPKFRDNLYHDAEEDFWLVPTAEVPVTNLHRDEIIDGSLLPLNYVAYTPCFRREKMSAGKDVRGIKRGHQFDKVEMFKFVHPATSNQELEKMVFHAEEVCRLLGIPHRVIQLSSADVGFSSSLTFDIEMWAQGCGEWLEVSSCSNCTDFQARRAQIRFRETPKSKPEFVHTLNGSGLALPRVMIAVMENYQQADGSIVIPEVLRPFAGGMEKIG